MRMFGMDSLTNFILRPVIKGSVRLVPVDNRRYIEHIFKAV